MKKYSIGILTAFFAMIIMSCQMSDGDNSNHLYHYKGAVAPYLHEISYTDYVYDSEGRTYEVYNAPACSVVRNGNFIGRNLDLFYDDVPEFIVRMKANKDRYASIGVARPANLHEKDVLSRNVSQKDMLLIPNMTTDGINEKGVFICSNIVSNEGKKMTGTNPGKKELNGWLIPREILNKAASADDAIDIMKNYNIVGDFYGIDNFHYMIADQKKTYIVEFIDNELVAEEKTGDSQIMTNFYCNLPELNEHATGVERYCVLKKNYAESASFKGMQSLLERVKFSELYNPDACPLRLSDSGLYSQSEIKSGIDMEEFIAMTKEYQKEFEYIFANEIRDVPSSDAWWITASNTTYDIEKRCLSIFVQENYKNEFRFSLSK